MGWGSVGQGFGCSFGEQGAKGKWLVATNKKVSVELLTELESLLIIRAKRKDPVDDTANKASKNTRWMCRVWRDV